MNTRAYAADLLERVLFAGASLTAVLSEAAPEHLLPKDRAFVQSIAFGVCRWYWQLEFFLRRLASRPIKDQRVKTLALVGLYQLARMRVKPHAAVAETVAAANATPWAKPFLNGLLRNFQRQRNYLLEELESDESALFSHPGWLIDRFRTDWPDGFRSILAENNASPPMTLRVNRRRANRQDYLTRLAQEGISAQPGEFSQDAVILEIPRATEDLPGFAEGLVSVQDEAAQLAAAALRPGTGHRVADVCAAPGGKTLHLLESFPEIREIVAVDVSDQRAGLIRANLDRVGLRAPVRTADAADLSAWWDGEPFDRILLDAPCSATGVIRRHPDIKLLRKEADIPALNRQQHALLASVWPALRPGGALLYATCSALSAENDSVIERFRHERLDAIVQPIDARWGRPTVHGRQIMAGDHGMDGFYYALLIRAG